MGTLVGDDVQECLQPRLDSGVRGVGVDLEQQVGLGTRFRRQQGVGEGVDGATEIADVQQEQVAVPLGQFHGVHDDVGIVPGGGPRGLLGQTVSGDHPDSHAGQFFRNRLRGLRRKGVVTAADQDHGRLSVGQRVVQGLPPEFPQGLFGLQLHPDRFAVGRFRRRSGKPPVDSRQLHHFLARLVTSGKVQQR